MEMLGRRALWEVGLNYGHGTGHGVGNYFGVHECMSYSTPPVLTSLIKTQFEVETHQSFCHVICILIIIILSNSFRASRFSGQQHSFQRRHVHIHR